MEWIWEEVLTCFQLIQVQFLNRFPAQKSLDSLSKFHPKWWWILQSLPNNYLKFLNSLQDLQEQKFKTSFDNWWAKLTKTKWLNSSTSYKTMLTSSKKRTLIRLWKALSPNESKTFKSSTKLMKWTRRFWASWKHEQASCRRSLNHLTRNSLIFNQRSQGKAHLSSKSSARSEHTNLKSAQQARKWPHLWTHI